jgi:hypothetical protein
VTNLNRDVAKRKKRDEREIFLGGFKVHIQFLKSGIVAECIDFILRSFFLIKKTIFAEKAGNFPKMWV